MSSLLMIITGLGCFIIKTIEPTSNDLGPKLAIISFFLISNFVWANIFFTSIHPLINYPLHLFSSSNLMIGGRYRFSVRPCYISRIFNVLTNAFFFFLLDLYNKKESKTSDHFYTWVMVLSVVVILQHWCEPTVKPEVSCWRPGKLQWS